uniref:Uncharacterized protein n=1 Tax=Cucumis melo TaxID=3656 RepID=A0A9I9EFL0_CUCME
MHDENPNLNSILLISTSFLLGDRDLRRGDIASLFFGVIDAAVAEKIKAKGDFIAMGGSFEKKRMKMNGNVDLGTACGKYYRVSCLSIIDPAAMENTVLEENTAAMFNINEVLPQSIRAMKPYLRQFIDV